VLHDGMPRDLDQGRETSELEILSFSTSLLRWQMTSDS